MRISRIYTDQELGPGRGVELDTRACRYVSQVLRLRTGQPLVLFNGNGSEFTAQLTRCDRSGCSATVGAQLATEQPAALQLHLGIGISRGERMDLAIQKSVELGVNTITPLFTERSMVQLKGERLDKRIAHWQGVVISACEQSGRNLLATLNPPERLQDWLATETGGLMLYHKAGRTLADLPPPASSLALLIGPEGGLSEAERLLAGARGFGAVRFGPRILRTETAPIAALAAIQMLWGDFR